MDTVTIRILKENKNKTVFEKNICLYYILKGTVVIEREGQTEVLKEKDIIVFNPEERHSLNTSSCIAACIEISYSRVLQLMGRQRKLIVCCIGGEKNENAVLLNRTISSLLRAYCEIGQNRIRFEQLSLQLIYLLITHYSVNVFNDEKHQRKNEIDAYIKANYMNDLTLEEISEEFHLTPQYFSKYFREVFGTTFLKYLNNLRVEYASAQLLSSEEAALRIAINNGFPNFASFLREFRSTFGVTPAEYRENHRRESLSEFSDDILSLLDEEKKPLTDQSIHLDIHNSMDYGELSPYWTEILNLRSFHTVMKNGMNEQIRFLKENLNFKTARLYLDTFQKDGRHHFYITDKVIQFLTGLGMKMIIVIDLRDIDDIPAFLSYFREQCRRLMNRYGNSIEDTVFELKYSTEYTEEALLAYRSLYEQLSAILLESRFREPMIGPGILMEYTGENFRKFVRKNPQIQTFSITSAPYSYLHKGDEVFINRITSSDYVLEQYECAKRILREEGRDAKVQIVSWKDRLNDVDVLNETSYLGCHIIQTALQGYGKLSALPLDYPLDLMFDEMIFDKAFNLLPGIVTSSGINKPSYYALKYLNQQDRYLVSINEHVLITRSDTDGFYQILCHNSKRPGYRYYMKDVQDQINEADANLFDDLEPLHFSFQFHDLPEGVYLLKIRSVSDESGCAFAGYKNLQYPDEAQIGYSEMSYFKAASVPVMTSTVYQVGPSGNLKVDCVLKGNEFRHMHIVRMIK